MLVLAAVALATTPAFASKARLNALQSANHFSDTRDMLTRPDQAMAHAEFATLELGTKGAASTPNAEGGFVRKMGDSAALGAYLGNYSGLASSSLALVTTPYAIQNPLNLVYANKMGDMSWGLGLQYAAAEDKVAKKKSSVMGLTASATSNAGWNAEIGLGLTGESSNTTTDVKAEQSSPLSISGGYAMDSLYIYGGYSMLGAKSKTAGTTTANVEQSTMSVGVINHTSKDGAHFFYGVEYNSTVKKDKEGTQAKTETSKLPVIVGIEADAASWLVLRGSIKQSVLMASTKTSDTTGTTSEKSLEDDTTIGGGIGIKLGKFIVDGTFTSAGTGKLGSDANFISEVGMTYKF